MGTYVPTTNLPLDIPTHLCYGRCMATKQVNRKDPRWTSVQLNVRMPFWQREQLEDEARALGMTTNALVLDAVERIYAPDPPK